MLLEKKWGNTVVGSEIPFPTTVWMVLKPIVNNGMSTTNLNWWVDPEFRVAIIQYVPSRGGDLTIRSLIWLPKACALCVLFFFSYTKMKIRVWVGLESPQAPNMVTIMGWFLVTGGLRVFLRGETASQWKKRNPACDNRSNHCTWWVLAIWCWSSSNPIWPGQMAQMQRRFW